MEYNDKIFEKIIDLGKLNYPLSKCINVLNLDEKDIEDFKKDFLDKESIVSKKYQIGIDLCDFEVDSKLYLLSKTGDLKALKVLEQRKKRYEQLNKEETNGNTYENDFTFD